MKWKPAVGLLSLLLAVSAFAADPIVPYDNPVLRDHNGKFMGHILSFQPSFESYYLMFGVGSNENTILQIDKEASGLTWASGPLFFASTDCTGQAFVFDHGEPVERVGRVGAGNVLYLSGTGPAAPSVFNSIYANHACQASSQPGSSDYDPANPFVNLDTVFQVPFKAADAAQAAPAMSSEVMILLAIVLAAAGLFAVRALGKG